NYNLTEHIEQGKNRINVPERGYIIERDDYYIHEPVWFKSAVRGYGWSFKNPDTDDITEQEVEYIRKYVNDFETALFFLPFGDPDKGYKRYIDMYSFARWFVFQQIIANIDTNFYLLKDGRDDNSKLTMGPVWDFEWTTGIGWYDGDRPRPADYWVLNGGSFFYFDKMLEDADFRALVKSVWAEYKSEAMAMLDYFDVLRQELYESQKLNFQRWDILDKQIHVGGIPLGSFDREVDCDIQFFKNHITWLETAFNDL
ncbi:MAG: CotH kinase family protein, partial [Tannerella sp.]|nr:CotH kinase family protein [Tannerella sp.]